MAVFFKPSDITTKSCTVNNLTRGGSAFAVCEDGEQVFIPPKIVDLTNIDVGDFLTAYCIDNHRPEADGETKYAVKWRAIRVTVSEKFAIADTTPPTPAVALTVPVEITTLMLADMCKKKLRESRAWTASQLAKELGVDTQRVSNWLFQAHERGDIAAARLYVSGAQERASKSWYARDIDLLTDLIDEITLED